MTLVDTHRRPHQTLRISVTDRCQMKCRYCLPNGAPPPLAKSSILTFEEIATITGIGAELGITRVRITGGEPLLRKGLPALVGMIRNFPSIETISLTTNGLLLDKHLDALIDAGLTQVSISIDSMHRVSFEEMTGCDALETVLTAVEKAAARPELTVELNAVAVKGKTESEVLPLIRFSREKNVPIRFIELMPFEDIEWNPSLLLEGAELLEIIEPEHDFEEVDRHREAAPARRFQFRDGRGGFGLIEPVSRPFCGACDRLRLRSDGMLYNCLFGRIGYDLRTPARAGDSGMIRDRIIQAVAEKGIGGMLEFNEQVTNPSRIMASIGG